MADSWIYVHFLVREVWARSHSFRVMNIYLFMKTTNVNEIIRRKTMQRESRRLIPKLSRTKKGKHTHTWAGKMNSKSRV